MGLRRRRQRRSTMRLLHRVGWERPVRPATASMCNNSVAGASSLNGGLMGYPLQVGYDLVTGLGSLDVARFLDAAATLDTVKAATSVALTASPGTIKAGQSVVFTAVVSAGGRGVRREWCSSLQWCGVGQCCDGFGRSCVDCGREFRGGWNVCDQRGVLGGFGVQRVDWGCFKLCGFGDSGDGFIGFSGQPDADCGWKRREYDHGFGYWLQCSGFTGLRSCLQRSECGRSADLQFFEQRGNAGVSGSGTSVVMVGTTVPHAQGGVARVGMGTFGGVWLAGLLAVVRRRRRFGAVLLLGLCGCGGTVGNSVPAEVLVGTSPGAYTVTVTASSAGVAAAATSLVVMVQ